MTDSFDQERDNWNRHWNDYAAAAEKNPAMYFRFSTIVDLVRSISPQPIQIVDVGCGTGALLEILQSEFTGAQLVGVEPSKSGFDIVSQRLDSVLLFNQDIVSKSLDNNVVQPGTIVVCSEVLEHLDDPHLLLRCIKSQFGKTGAQLVVSVPGGVRSAFDVHIGHRRHYTRETLEFVMRQAGLSEIRIWRAGFPFFNIYKLLTVILGRRLISRKSSVSLESAWFRYLSRLLTICMRVSFRD